MATKATKRAAKTAKTLENLKLTDLVDQAEIAEQRAAQRAMLAEALGGQASLQLVKWRKLAAYLRGVLHDD